MRQFFGGFLIGASLGYLFLGGRLEFFMIEFAIVIGIDMIYQDYVTKFGKGKK